MQVFINEKSLHGQYNDHTIEDAIRTFLTTINIVNGYQINKTVYATKYFFDLNAINGTHLGSILSSNNSLKETFFQNIKNAEKWQDNRVHQNNTTYTYNENDYVDTSIAELTERKFQNNELKGFLLNFTHSIFDEIGQIQVLRNGNINITIDCSYDEDSVINWFVQNNFIDPNEQYNTSSKIPPRDYQTILRNNTIFEMTQWRNHGRRVYRKIGSNELWVVDNMHYGNDAHIEVFRETDKEHLGTSPYNDIRIEIQYRDEGRNIEL